MKHILIAEDDADNNTMLKEYLENHGYRCTQAFSGSEAKLLFSVESFDLVQKIISASHLICRNFW